MLLLCAACTQADIVSPGPGGSDAEEGVPLRISRLGLSVETETRGIVTGGPGEEGKTQNPLTAVGVCVTKQKGSGTVSLYDSNVRSQQFVYDAPGWVLADGEDPLSLYTEKGTVYAYAPAEKSVSLKGTPKVPVMSGVRVSDKQTCSFDDGEGPGGCGDRRTLGYRPGGLPVGDGRSGGRPLAFGGVASDEACAGESQFPGTGSRRRNGICRLRVAKVVLKSDGGGLKKTLSTQLNLGTGELEGMTAEVGELSFSADGSQREVGSGTVDASEVAIQAFGLVIPVTEVSATLVLTLDDGRTFNMKPADEDADDAAAGTFTVSWQKGYNYIYRILLYPQGIQLTDIRVVDWIDGGSHDIGVE